MDMQPPIMVKLLVLFKTGEFDFAYYKDGKYLVGDNWYTPNYFDGWIDMDSLKRLLGL